MSNDLQVSPKIPQYLRICEEIREQIASGRLRPGDRLPSYAEMKRLGVNKYTVERAQAVLEQEGLIVREHGMGTFVAPPHRKSLKGMIAFSDVGFINNEFSAYWVHLFEGVEEATNANETQVLLLRGNSTHGWDKVDGVLLNGLQIRAEWPSVKCLLPTVALLAPPPGGVLPFKISSVVADDYLGMRQATEHLLQLGHRRIAFLNNSVIDHILFPRRFAGYQDALQEAGVKIEEKWSRSLPTPTPLLYFRSTGREAMRQWLREDWRELGCTSLLAHNDDTALGAIEALREAGYDVPGDISVIGFDGTEICECSDPPLTSVEIPLQEIGKTGAELLLRKIENDDHTVEHIVLPASLRVRGTTAAPSKS